MAAVGHHIIAAGNRPVRIFGAAAIDQVRATRPIDTRTGTDKMAAIGREREEQIVSVRNRQEAHQLDQVIVVCAADRRREVERGRRRRGVMLEKDERSLELRRMRELEAKLKDIPLSSLALALKAVEHA